jgi:hypothetical protein
LLLNNLLGETSADEMMQNVLIRCNEAVRILSYELRLDVLTYEMKQNALTYEMRQYTLI